MSDEFYPISLIRDQQVTPLNRVIADQFEDGTTATRDQWATMTFKRRFEVAHSVMNLGEWWYLRSFYNQRHGMYDSFWFRDNVDRGGNAKVRFSQPLPRAFNAAALASIQVQLDEIAPIRSLPEFDELTTAAGTAPYVWIDANRELYWKHAGTAYFDPAGTTWDAGLNARRLTWTAASVLSGLTSQYQYLSLIHI